MIMRPSSVALLKNLRAAAGQLSSELSDPAQKYSLACADELLNELMLRNDDGFYLDACRSGASLLAEGLSMRGLGELDFRPDFREGVSADYRQSEIENLLTNLAAMLGPLDEGQSPEEKNFARRVSDWELSLYRRQTEQGGGRFEAGGSADNVITAETLQQWIRDNYPRSGEARVSDFTEVPGGFSKQTILFELENAAGNSQSLAVRAERAARILDLDGSKIANEFPVLQIAHAAGLPVPEPLWLETDAAKLGTRFIILRKAEGRNFGTVVGASETVPRPVIEHLAEILARLHSIKLDPDDPRVLACHLKRWVGYKSMAANTLAYAKYWRDQAQRAGVDISPSLSRSFNWMEHNVPETTEAPCLIHCDYGLHNILIDGDRVSALLDWEVSRYGDPAEDLSWFFSQAGDMVDQTDFLQLYYAAGGRPINEFNLRYFRVLRCVSMITVCLHALKMLEEKDDANLNLALIGLQYLPLFANQLNEAISSAEQVRPV